MSLERYTKEELIPKCEDIFLDFMSSTEDFYDEGNYLKCTDEYPTPMDMLYKELLNSIEENEARIKMFNEAIEENKNDSEVVKVMTEQLQPLLEEKEHFANSCMSYQKELYKKTKITDYSRNLVRIPLDKKINSYYDDLILEVLFYDDIAVAKGHYNEYKALKTQEERRAFIAKYTEITHMGLVIMNKQSSQQIGLVQVKGMLDFGNERVSSSGILLLKDTFCDFKNLTLKQTMSIQNNDIRQLFQSKIDLDKENMEVLADIDLIGDNYKLLRSATLDDDEDRNDGKKGQLFIRYVCPSTQRVYYNPINKRYLANSEYFKEDKFDSYLEAWWSVCHLGADPHADKFARC